jgi:hypothetical protein
VSGEGEGLFVFDACLQFIRTVPGLPRDVTDPDDVDSDAEDHIGDEVRYHVYRRAPPAAYSSHMWAQQAD